MAEKKKTKKAPLKQREPYKFYRNGYYACKTGTVGSLLTPLAVLFGVKWEEYVTVSTSEGGGNLATFKLTLGGLICLMVAVIMIYKYIKHDEKAKKQVTMVSFVTGLAVAFALCWCFNAILQDLTEILGYELIGAVSAYGFDLGAQNRRKYMETYNDEATRVKARRAEAQKWDGTSV